jgi:hypothetical protein
VGRKADVALDVPSDSAGGTATRGLGSLFVQRYDQFRT